MADMIRGVCPQCGKKSWRSRRELEEFFLPVLRGAHAHRGPAGKARGGAGLEALLAQLPGCITRYPDLHLASAKKATFPDVRAV